MGRAIDVSGRRQDLIMAEGTGKTFVAVLKDLNGNVVDATGATGTWYFRNGPEDTSTLNLSPSISVYDGPNGKVSAVVFDTDLDGILSGQAFDGWHACFVTLPGGEVQRVVYGSFHVRVSAE